MTTRRSFLSAILVGAIAPAIVRPATLMKIWVPPEPKILTLEDYADGQLDATDFLQSLIDAGGIVTVPNGVYTISATLRLKPYSIIHSPGGGATIKASKSLSSLIYVDRGNIDCNYTQS